MHYYEKHIFFCTNKKQEGKKCCLNFDSENMCAYAKEQLKKLNIYMGQGGVRVSKSGCLGRCSVGPCIVIYPDNIWYTYSSKDDIDKIIHSHFVENKVLHELTIPA